MKPKVVVLDDDPTGTQTVHGVPVLTVWDVDTLAAELITETPAFFILTNTRALPVEQAVSLNQEIGANLCEAGKQTGRPFVVVSRSDSTLRGHFPQETDVLKEAIGIPHAAVLLCPYFAAGGRVTIDDIHYLRQGEQLTPVGETEFARDATFGYRSSNLREWVEEKTGGRISANAVHSVSLDTIRHGGASGVAAILRNVPASGVCILNCETDADLTVLANGVREAERQSGVFLYRTAAGFAAARAGIAQRPLLTPAELNVPPSGGILIVVGSYVSKTTEQLARLRESGIVSVEVAVSELLSANREQEIARAASAVSDTLAANTDVVLYTSRQPIAAGNLNVGALISASLVSLVKQIRVRPRALIAKGGITSSDLATDALNVRRAEVLGQIAPGVPVWRLGPESRWPELAYVVFPGNVGTADTLAQVRASLSLAYRDFGNGIQGDRTE